MLMALRGRRAIPARQELTGHRGLMVRRAIPGLLALTVTPVHQVLMGCLRMRLRSMPGLLGTR